VEGRRTGSGGIVHFNPRAGIIALLLAALLAVSPAHAKRVALVIGNSDYSQVSKLAHQWTAPTDEGTSGEHGAIRLAIVGLASFPVLPSQESSLTRTPVPAGEVVEGEFVTAWPIWRSTLSLTGIRALLACGPRNWTSGRCEVSPRWL
jgi:hypothetical protein